MTILVCLFGACLYSFLSIFTRSGIADITGYVCSTSIDIARQLPKWLYQFTPPQTTHESFICSIFSQNLAFFVFFILAILMDM